jgi:hypothetical protein
MGVHKKHKTLRKNNTIKRNTIKNNTHTITDLSNITIDEIKSISYKENTYIIDKYFNSINKSYSVNVKFDSISNNILEIIFIKSFGTTDFFINSKSAINDIITKTTNEYIKKNKIRKSELQDKKWIICKNECKYTLQYYIEQETSSTAYYIRLLCNSIMCCKNDYKPLILSLRLKENFGIDSLNGKWVDDIDKLIITGFETHDTTDNIKPRLIMGFGPSASGKTKLTNELIKLLIDVEGNQFFPNTFISIDGGIIREASLIYRTIVDLISLTSDKIVAGFLNLNVSNKHKSIILSNDIKKLFIKTLINHYRNKISVYIPDTLGNCIINCNKIIKNGIDLTGDNNWIGILIWQHKKTTMCNYNSKFKCLGTITSGKIREITEGKKYSSIAWRNSMYNGLRMLNKSKSYKLIIHNSGGLKFNNKVNKSILEDKTTGINKNKIFKYFKNNNPQFLNFEIFTNNNKIK